MWQSPFKFRQPRARRIICLFYKLLLQQHQSNVFNQWYAIFPRGHRTSTCPLGWELNTLVLVSFTFETSSILQCKRLLLVAITNKNIIYLSVPELENSVFLDLLLLSCTPVASNSFSWPSLRSNYTSVKYMFLNFSTQWNSIGRRNRRWKVALKQGAWVSLHFHSRFQN